MYKKIMVQTCGKFLRNSQIVIFFTVFLNQCCYPVAVHTTLTDNVLLSNVDKQVRIYHKHMSLCTMHMSLLEGLVFLTLFFVTS